MQAMAAAPDERRSSQAVIGDSFRKLMARYVPDHKLEIFICFNHEIPATVFALCAGYYDSFTHLLVYGFARASLCVSHDDVQPNLIHYRYFGHFAFLHTRPDMADRPMPISLPILFLLPSSPRFLPSPPLRFRNWWHSQTNAQGEAGPSEEGVLAPGRQCCRRSWSAGQ